MKILSIVYCALALVWTSCTTPNQNRDINSQLIDVDTLNQIERLQESALITEDSMGTDSILNEFQVVIDTLNSADDILFNFGYFLYDITNDGKPELWISIGSCEATTKLMAYTIDRGKPRKIFDGLGGHSDYLIYDGKLICVMCNTGSGTVRTYQYIKGIVKEKVVEFSFWNDKSKPLSKSNTANIILDYWENNSDNYIELMDIPK